MLMSANLKFCKSGVHVEHEGLISECRPDLFCVASSCGHVEICATDPYIPELKKPANRTTTIFKTAFAKLHPAAFHMYIICSGVILGFGICEKTHVLGRAATQVVAQGKLFPNNQRRSSAVQDLGKKKCQLLRHRIRFVPGLRCWLNKRPYTACTLTLTCAHAHYHHHQRCFMATVSSMLPFRFGN